jgi:hypothetical protein
MKLATVDDLADRFSYGLALIEGEDLAEIVLVFDHRIIPFAQHWTALLCSLRRSFLLCKARCGNRGVSFSGAEFWYATDEFPGSRVVNVDGVTCHCRDPVATDNAASRKRD